MNNNEIQFKYVFLYSLVQCLYYYCVALSIVWKPILRQRSNLSRERENLNDRYAIAAYKRLPGRPADSIIGHLSREISRPTGFSFSFFFFFFKRRGCFR